MKLSIAERLVLPSLLPSESDFVTQKKLAELKEKLWFTDEELKRFNVRVESGQVTWDPKANVEVEVPIGEIAEKEIIQALKTKNAERTLTADLITLYEKFVETPPKA